jgi:hypothetical protein
MAGTARTDDFMLGAATVMIGPMADLMDLMPEKHSIGMVKNFKIAGDPQYTSLTQGVKSTLVASVLTSNIVTASMEVYEYTIANLNYALGLNGHAADPTSFVATTAAAAATTVQFEDVSHFNDNDWVDIVKPDGSIFTTKLSAKNVGNKTFTVTPAVPTGGLEPAGGTASASTKGRITLHRSSGTVSAAGTGTPASPDADLALGTGEGEKFGAGMWVAIQTGQDDKVTIRQVASVSTDTLTFDQGIKEIVPVGAKVERVFYADVGSKDDQPFFGAKIVGTLANNKEVVILIPKIRISKGFDVTFGSSDFGNMPFEFQIYDQIASDPMYTKLNGLPARVFSK